MRIASKATLELARLDAAAQGAGYALACVHQSAEEFHRALVRRYLSLHRPRHWPIPAAAAVVAAILILI
jgi:hypothetical protein